MIICLKGSLAVTSLLFTWLCTPARGTLSGGFTWTCNIAIGVHIIGTPLGNGGLAYYCPWTSTYYMILKGYPPLLISCTRNSLSILDWWNPQPQLIEGPWHPSEHCSLISVYTGLSAVHTLKRCTFIRYLMLQYKVLQHCPIHSAWPLRPKICGSIQGLKLQCYQ